jgi:hypothetical protein
VRKLAHRLRGFGQLRNAGDALLLVRMGTFAATVPLLMRLPLPRLSRVVTRSTHAQPQPSPPHGGELERLASTMDLATRVAHPLVRTGCLTRGVTLYWFARRAGFDVELRFGIDPADAEAHCWLTLDGEPVLEKRDPRAHYVETFRLPARAEAV